MFKDTCLVLGKQVAQQTQEFALTALQRIALEGRRLADQEQRTPLRVHVITEKQKIEEQ